jgi:GT2 family glycosyltransferase
VTALRLSLCILCHDRPADLLDALASATGFDEVVVCDMASTPPLPAPPAVEFLRSEENLGVALGRNLLAGQATGDVIVFLDDDATFASRTAVDDIRAAFGRDESTVAVAFRVERADGHVESSEFPFRGAPRPLPRCECSYFVGCGVAIRRDAFLAAGGFDDRYGYSTEELDLSFSLLHNGGVLRYEPAITVVHRPSPRGRAPAPNIPALRLRNRLLLARRHLPAGVAVVHAAAWGLRTLREAWSAHGVREWCGAWRDGVTLPVVRRPLSYRELRRVHRHGGRVWW